MKKSFFSFLMLALVVLPVTAHAYNKDYFGEMVVYRAAFEDTLIHLARENGLGFVELRAANPTLDPWIPGEDAKIILPQQHLLPDAPRQGIVINLAEMRVYYFKDKGEAPMTWPISIGREGLQTPTGTTSIVRKKEGPTWRPTPRMREEDPNLPESVPPGPENPLGTHAMYLGWPQYLMHGTNKPYGIGRRVSSGCIRMYPEDIKRIYPQVPVGTQVTVVDQPVKVGWIGDTLHVEVSPTQDQSKRIEEDGVLTSYEIQEEDMQRINRMAGSHRDRIDWEQVRKAVQEHRGYPVPILSLNNRSGEVASTTPPELPRAEERPVEVKADEAPPEEQTTAAAVQNEELRPQPRQRARGDMNYNN
jgi:L,D-transpeptidase ErfK/SrfK